MEHLKVLSMDDLTSDQLNDFRICQNRHLLDVRMHNLEITRRYIRRYLKYISSEKLALLYAHCDMLLESTEHLQEELLQLEKEKIGNIKYTEEDYQCSFTGINFTRPVDIN